jgi:hypothetical protein
VLKCSKSKKLVAKDWSTKGTAILILVQRIFRSGKETARIDKVVPDELERRSVVFVPERVTMFTSPSA